MQVRTLQCDGYGDAAAACTDVDDPPLVRSESNGGLHELLGFGTRDENAGIDPELAAEELGTPANVLQGLTAQPPAEIRAKTGFDLAGGWLVVVGKEPHRVVSGCIGEEQVDVARIDPRPVASARPLEA